MSVCKVPKIGGKYLTFMYSLEVHTESSAE